MSTSAERPRWHLRDLFTEPPAGSLSQPKTWGNVGGATLCTAFLREVWKRDLSYDDFIGFAVALAVITTPTLAAKLIGLRYGNGNGKPSEIPPK